MTTPLPLATWRLIRTPPATGAWNMAVDEAILEAVRNHEQPPTLRLYDWAPPTLSLGYAQPYKDLDPLRLSQNGWQVVRRATGGRAILHADELTYAVIGPQNEPRLNGGVLESYRRLAGAILNALHRLDLPAESQVIKTTNNQGNAIDPVCFDVPSNYEITIQGKKLVGSAQSRKQGGVLQHGTLPLHGDLTRITQVLSYPDDRARKAAATRLLARATTVEACLGVVVSWEAAAQAFEAAFGEALNLAFKKDELSSEELSRTNELMAAKYDNAVWLQKR